MELWRKKLQKYLSKPENSRADFSGLELSSLFPVLLRLTLHAGVPVVAALPDAVTVDALRASLDEAMTRLDSPLRLRSGKNRT